MIKKEILKCLKENKDKISRIEECKSEKSKEYNDNQLFVLWEHYMRKTRAPKFCLCFDLTRLEYAYCMENIFGKKSAENFLNDTATSKSWQEKSSRRNALDIIATYKRRGLHFLDNIPKPETPMQKKYLNEYGELNSKGKLLLSTLRTTS